VTNTTIKTTYTSDGEVASETEILGSPNSGKVQSEAIYTYSYDENGNKTEISKEISDGTQSITTTVYDVMGRVITCEVKFTEENNSENNNSKNNKLEKNTYDSFGRLIYSKHTEGSIVTETSKSYYPNGTIKSETLEDKTVNSYTYDETNRVKTQTVSKGNLTKTWTNEYSYETVSITGKELIRHLIIHLFQKKLILMENIRCNLSRLLRKNNKRKRKWSLCRFNI
ncbi:MAG: hypothetical protein ACLRPW_12795, partial [Intestinibacter sp.]